MKFWIMICLNLYFRVINFVDSFCCFIFVDDCSVLFDNLVNEEKMVFIFIDIILILLIRLYWVILIDDDLI